MRSVPQAPFSSAEPTWFFLRFRFRALPLAASGPAPRRSVSQRPIEGPTSRRFDPQGPFRGVKPIKCGLAHLLRDLAHAVRSSSSLWRPKAHPVLCLISRPVSARRDTFTFIARFSLCSEPLLLQSTSSPFVDSQIIRFAKACRQGATPLSVVAMAYVSPALFTSAETMSVTCTVRPSFAMRC